MRAFLGQKCLETYLTCQSQLPLKEVTQILLLFLNNFFREIESLLEKLYLIIFTI